MFWQQLFSSPEIVSIEIGGEFLKLAHVKKTTRGIEVLHLASQDIRPMSDEEITTFIKTYLAEHHITTQQAVTFISPRYTSNKNIELPSTDPAEIKEIIKLQAGRHTPYSKEEIVIDYIPIGVFKGGYTKVLLVIVNRDIIKKYQDIIERTGLRLKKVVLGAEIINNWLQDIRGISSSPVCLIHFDYGNVDFIAVQNGKITFARSIPVGAYQLAGNPDEYRDKFLGEIKSSLESYQLENVEKIKQAVFVGLPENLKDLGRAVEDQFGLSVETLTYLDRIPFAPSALGAKETATRDGSFLTVINLPRYYRMKALLDLTPEEIRLREIMAEKSREIVLAGTLIMFILIIGSALLAKTISYKNTLLDSFQEIYNKEQAQVEELKANYNQVKSLMKYLNGKNYALEAWMEVNKVVPESIYLTKSEFRVDNQTLVLVGYGEIKESNADDIAVFNNALDKSPLFRDVTMKKSRTRVGDKDAYEFEITCHFGPKPAQAAGSGK